MTDPTDLIRRGDAIAWCEEQHRIWARSLGRDPEKYAGAFTTAADILRRIPAHPVQEPPSPGVTAGATGEAWDDPPVWREVGAELSGIPGELIDKMAEAIRGDTTCDDTPWAVLSEDRKIGWRGDAERALAAVKEYLTAHRPAPVVPAEGLEDYDAGLLNDFGGGDVGWWQDYLRAEIGRANDFWRDQVSALRSAPPVGAQVKPLVWKLDDERPEDFPRWEADTDLGKTYHVFKAWWGAQDKWGFVGIDGFYHTEDAAKAAAQADYEARILAALLPAGEGE